MSPPGRPKGESRRAQHERFPVTCLHRRRFHLSAAGLLAAAAGLTLR